jgi:hypothetical protein
MKVVATMLYRTGGDLNGQKESGLAWEDRPLPSLV